ncbi:MAG: hypothetical protein R3B54_09315 [Bdellovibrionota bacterium]
MGGNLALIYSQPGRGSTFRITLDPGPLDDIPMDAVPPTPHEADHA